MQPSFPGRNFARFQRAAKSTGQSAGGGCDNVIQRGGMRLVNLGVDAVMRCDLGMNAEQNRFIFLGQISST
jgi:hypothetical protein